MKNKSNGLSIIDKEIKIEGSIFSKGNLVIKGMVKGSLIGETVVIAEEGEVYADTKASNITIGGKYEGEIEATENLTILSTGDCKGKVACKELTVENGGLLNASVTYTQKGEIAAPGDAKSLNESIEI